MGGGIVQCLTDLKGMHLVTFSDKAVIVIHHNIFDLGAQSYFSSVKMNQIV